MYVLYTKARYVLMYNLCVSSIVMSLFSLLLKKNSKDLTSVQDSELSALKLVLWTRHDH